MQADHAVFGCIEEMVQQVLMPDWGVSGGESADAHSEEIHVEKSDLGPGVEGRGEAKYYIGGKELVLMVMKRGSRGDQKFGKFYAPKRLTFKPPPLTYTKIFAILGFWNLAAVFLFRLRNIVVGLASAFFHQVYTRPVCDVSFCRYGRFLADFFRDLSGRVSHEGTIRNRAGIVFFG